MDEAPKVTVVIPTYNYAHCLVHSLSSVLNQTFKQFEVVVVDDGSVDNTPAVVSSCDDPRVHYIYQENKGLPGARNTGIEAARGELIAFLDSDDIWLPHKLLLQVAAFEKRSDLGMVYGEAELIDDNGVILKEIRFPRNLPFPSLYENLLGRNVIPGSASSVMMSRKCLEKVGGFHHACGGVADLDMWRRVALHYACHGIPEILTQIRSHCASMTNARRGYMAEGMVACIRRATSEAERNVQFAEALRFAQRRMYAHAFYYFLEDAVRDYRIGVFSREQHNVRRALAAWGSIPGNDFCPKKAGACFDEMTKLMCRWFIGVNNDVRSTLDGVETLIRAASRHYYISAKDKKALTKRGRGVTLLYVAQQMALQKSWRARGYALYALWNAPNLLLDRRWLKAVVGESIVGIVRMIPVFWKRVPIARGRGVYL